MSEDRPLHLDTVAAQAAHYLDRETGGVVPPVQPSTTYVRRAQDYGLTGTTSYTRDHNPTYDPLEKVLCALEGGTAAAAFSAGLGAASAVVQALQPGDHIVAQRSMYWGFRSWLEDFCPRWGLGLDLVDATRSDNIAQALKPGVTKLVWIETPSNPLWEITDIRQVAGLAKSAGARLAVDNTVSTPILTRPLELGADLVMHSATKYLNGHSDVLAGALITAREDEFWERILYNRAKLASVLGPFEAWLLLRGLRTLSLRVERACANAQAIAEHFQDHEAIERVLYPGLADHPGHDVAKSQMTGGFGGMLSLCLAGGEEAALRLAKRTKLFLRATSLGGPESLIEHRATIEGAAGVVPKNLLRLSMGIEHLDDLVADLEQALA
ncbi:MAG: PLP-dependent aspartate aminotransferase family protein [Pseudomonadota bacterium]